jgi:hypothetical protein
VKRGLSFRTGHSGACYFSPPCFLPSRTSTASERSHQPKPQESKKRFLANARNDKRGAQNDKGGERNDGLRVCFPPKEGLCLRFVHHGGLFFLGDLARKIFQKCVSLTIFFPLYAMPQKLPALMPCSKAQGLFFFKRTQPRTTAKLKNDENTDTT